MEKLYFVFGISIIGLLLLIRNAFLFYFKRNDKSISYKIICYFLIIDAINEIICNYVGFTSIGKNLVMSHTHYHLVFLFNSLLFYQLLPKSINKWVGIITISVSATFVVYYSCYPALLFQISAVETFIISLLIVIYALLYLYKSIGEKASYFNYSIGLIMYLICSSIVFFSGNIELVFCNNPYIDIWVFNSIFFIIYQLFIYKDWKLLTKNDGK